ncbi:MAG TPA: type VI secretion system protein [Thermoanaerobaculia bacterium]|jgi:type VI secretion system protein ImpL|nr:type VI secretion system protein [Thermoanaerobaculia bacterium]
MDALSSSSAPYLLAAALALALGLALVLWLVLRQSRREGGLREVADDPETTVVDFSGESSDAEIRASFTRSLEQLARLAPGSNGRYELPWFVMIGGTPQGNAEVLASLRIPLPFGAPQGPSAPIAWWIFDRAVVIEASGAASATDAEGAPAPGAWVELIRSLRATRPTRPIDGLIVAIPAGDLQGAEPSSAAVQNRSTLLATRAAQLVERLGFRLPVHVAITGAEALSGFAPTVATIPSEQRGQMLAWANAQGLTTAYSSAWTSEAVATLARGFARHQLDTFADPTLPDAVREVYLFPQQVVDLGPALAAYLNRIFLPSTDAEPSFFRSLGLCGRVTADAPAPADTPETLANFGWARADAGASNSATAAEISFVEDLFAAKIFPERALARPAGSTEKRRLQWGQTLRAATAVAAVVAIVGLAYGPRQVANRTWVLEPWFTSAAERLHPGTDGDSSTEPPQTSPQTSNTDRDLLSSLDDIRSFRVQTWMLPASIGSGVDRDVRSALTTAHAGIFLPDVKNELIARRNRLAAGLVPAKAPKQKGAGAVESTGEFLDLAGFARRIAEQETQARRYNGFTGGKALPGRRLTDFQELSSYALGVSFKPPTSSAKDSLAASLGAVALPTDEAIPLVADQGLIGRGWVWVEQLFGKIFGASWVRLGAEKLATDIDSFGRSQSAGGEAYREMRKLLKEIQGFEQTLKRPDQQWLAGATFAPGAAYQAAIETLARSAWLGSAFGPDVSAQGNQGFRRMQDDLIGLKSVYVGPILANADGRPKLALAPEAAMLEPAIQGLLGEPFVPQDPPRAWQAILPPGQRLTWDTGRLTDTAGLGTAYESFLAKGLQAFPPSLRRTAGDAARNRLSWDVSDNLAAAQTFTPAQPPAGQTPLELTIQGEATNFSAAATPLGQILGFGQRLNLGFGVLPLAGLMGQQGERILLDLEKLLIASRLYLPKPGSLEKWDGKKPPSPDVFGVTTPSALTTYLGSQRGRVSQLANTYAQPVLNGLQPATALVPAIASKRVVGEWNAILAALVAANQQNAGGSVADLEGFISGKMTKLTVANCTAELAGGGPPGRDYFRRRESEYLWAPLEDQCRALLVEAAESGYCQLRASFGDELAGQYPFARRDPLENGAEAQPAALARFFAIYDKQQPLIVQAPEGTFGIATGSIQTFLDQMAEVRNLFAPFLAKPSAPPTFDWNVVFRANRSREQEGRQIYNWAIRSGEQTISTTNPGEATTAPAAADSSTAATAGGASGAASTTLGRWSFGRPVSVAFTWAQNSPWQPAVKGQEPHAASDGTMTVTYTFTNAWALLSLLRDQAGTATDFPNGTDPDPQTLRFEMATGPNLQAPSAEAATPILTNSVRVYVRVPLQSPDQKQRLILPAVFPVEAPAYTCPAR